MAEQKQTQTQPNGAVPPAPPAPKVVTLIELLPLDAAQRGALAQKFDALAPEIRATIAASYPQATSSAERYIIRQMVREANGKLASVKRPYWYNQLLQWGPVLNHIKDKENKDYQFAVEKLRTLAEEFDTKEATGLLRKFKAAQDVTSTTPYIVELCKLFGVEPNALTSK